MNPETNCADLTEVLLLNLLTSVPNIDWTMNGCGVFFGIWNDRQIVVHSLVNIMITISISANDTLQIKSDSFGGIYNDLLKDIFNATQNAHHIAKVKKMLNM